MRGSHRMLPMADSPLRSLRQRLSSAQNSPLAIAEESLTRANGNASRNTYVAQSREWTLQEAERLPHRSGPRPPLYGVPVSLKDCFDLQGFPTSCGSKFYEKLHGPAQADSWVAAQLRSQGAVITGKTHLHPLAYGITGENPEYGDCVQPRNEAWLTGGSSSGAAASVQEGSALAAIGTDTGGSIRVPAALCGLAGYRSSVGLGSWQGAHHLAPSFDTLGWIYRDLRDGPALAHALLGIEPVVHQEGSLAIGAVYPAFLHDCEPPILRMYEDCKQAMERSGASVKTFDASYWDEAMQIFAPIQAQEASVIHRGHYTRFEALIAERLAWGASITTAELTELRERMRIFNRQLGVLLSDFDFLIVPCAPLSRLMARADHSSTRRTILRYTTPMSLAGVPVVTLPFPDGGIQLVAARGEDARLLAYSAYLDRICDRLQSIGC